MLIVFAEIQGLRLGRNTLAGVVLEFPAFLRIHDDTLLDAQILVFVHFCSVGAVRAGAGHFLSEQHIGEPPNIDGAIILQWIQNFYNFFHFSAVAC